MTLPIEAINKIRHNQSHNQQNAPTKKHSNRQCVIQDTQLTLLTFFSLPVGQATNFFDKKA